jgi:hypothetical protein
MYIKPNPDAGVAAVTTHGNGERISDALKH